MRKELAKTGFTLIELLVVVLIIGILAAVALPQYQKAVRKARLSEVATTFNAISKGIDMYLLENGHQAIYVPFSGTNATAQLDIDIPCATKDSGDCYTKVGSWAYYCYPTKCNIALYTDYHADGTTGNKWLGNSTIIWNRTGDGEWGINLTSIDPSSETFIELCRWWKDMYSKDRFVDSNGDVSNVCNVAF